MTKISVWLPLTTIFCLLFPLFCFAIDPEDAVFLDEVTLQSINAAQSYFRLGGLVGSAGFWSAEGDIGTQISDHFQFSLMASRTQVGSPGTNEVWASGTYRSSTGATIGITSIYGAGPDKEKYFGALGSGSLRLENFRLRLQSGLLQFDLPNVLLAKNPLRPIQVPIKGEVSWQLPFGTVAVGAGYFFSSEDHSSLSRVLGSTTVVTGYGILSGFPLNQVYARGELPLSPQWSTSLSLSSALSAYQTDRVISLSGRTEWEINGTLVLGGEFCLSPAGLALGPTLLVLW